MANPRLVRQPGLGTSALPEVHSVRFTSGQRRCSRQHIVCAEGSRGYPVRPTHFPVAFGKGLCNPQRLLSSEADEATVWTLRFFTGQARGSGLSDTSAGVQLCLVGKSGEAVLHRISAHHDSASAREDVLNICKAAGKQLSANCSDGARKALSRLVSAHPSMHSRFRFKQGAVDEVSFLGAEIGPLASLLVGPEHGSWFVEEIAVCSSRTQHLDRFICRHALGEGRSHPSSAFLTPVPADHVVYGTGASAKVVNQTQARILHAAGMKGYLHLKSQLLYGTALLVGTGGVCAYMMDGWNLALPFSVGGMGGLTYQWLLQQGADAIPGGSLFKGGSSRRAGSVPGALLRRATSTPASRFLFSIAMLLMAVAVSDNIDTQHLQLFSLHGQDGLHHVMVAALGFLMFKLAVVCVAMTPTEPMPLLTRLDKRTS